MLVFVCVCVRFVGYVLPCFCLRCIRFFPEETFADIGNSALNIYIVYTSCCAELKERTRTDRTAVGAKEQMYEVYFFFVWGSNTIAISIYCYH